MSLNTRHVKQKNKGKKICLILHHAERVACIRNIIVVPPALLLLRFTGLQLVYCYSVHPYTSFPFFTLSLLLYRPIMRILEITFTPYMNV